MISLQGSLSIERMCQLVAVSRRFFYELLRDALGAFSAWYGTQENLNDAFSSMAIP